MVRKPTPKPGPKGEAPDVPLQIEGGGMDRSRLNQMGAELDARLTERISAKMDLLQQKVDGQMNALEREISAKLDNKPSQGALVTHTLATIAIIVTVIIGFLAFGGSTFSGGFSASGAFADQLVQEKARDTARDLEAERRFNELRQEIRRALPPPSNGVQANVSR